MRILTIILSVIVGSVAIAAKGKPDPKAPNVKYKKADDLDFEAMLIKGHGDRPEVSVVTGNVNQGGDGLLRLRKDFLDKVTVDYGEEIK